MNLTPAHPGRPDPWSARSIEDLTAELSKLGQPRYRAKQFHDALHADHLVEWSAATTMPQLLRLELASRRPLRSLSVASERVSRLDGTSKLLFVTRDGGLVESVLMFSSSKPDSRTTVCISSQIGCPAACTFCASGLGGFARNLTVAEIVDQVSFLATRARAEHRRIDNIVFMGMGEPFLNYGRVMAAISHLRNPEGLGVGARRITVSTVGIVPGIDRFADDAGEINLAISLHAPHDHLREQLVPYNRLYPIAAILESAGRYMRRTNRRVSFEYVLLLGTNDSPALASALGRLLKPMNPLVHVNVIPWNQFPEAPFDRATRHQAEQFAENVIAAGVNTTIRYSKGLDIDAACGQLRRQTETQAMAS
jgi:23S rRNA (adenine2503-C2)-methyltransferase